MIEIPLTQGQVALVDNEDAEFLANFTWRASKGRNDTYYAKTQKDKKTLYMHRLLLDANPGLGVDHKNGNGLDNRRENIRVCTVQENRFNRHCGFGKSSYKGVSWYKRTGKWQAYIHLDKKFISLGYYFEEKDAARAYNTAAFELYGEFCCLNEIGE